MSNTTKRIFILSLIATIISSSAFFFFAYKIRQQGLHLEEQISLLKESDKKESAYLKLKRTALETESRRKLLAESFFKEEGDSIIFLGEVETLASSLGLSLETESLDKVINKDKGTESILISFSYTGPKDVVYNFSKLMEIIPYHSQVESLNLLKVSESNWEGKLSVLITVDSI